MNNELTAIVFGATGLVGSHLLQRLLKDDRYTSVKVFHRRSTGITHPKLHERIIDFDDPAAWADEVQGDHLFLCMGTTLKKAGSEEAQYTIDHTYPYEAAQAARKNGVNGCAVVSSAGADAHSRGFYLRMKGELDEDLQKLEFTQLLILRPSVLDGDRGEFRLGEKIGLFFGRLIGKIPGIRKYRAIHAGVVAAALIKGLNTESNSPVRIYELDEIFRLVED